MLDMDGYQYLPSLSLDEYEALRESVRRYGVIQPVIVDEKGTVIDGYHRVKVCKELGIKHPTRVMEGLSEEEKENLSVSLNIKRRHLTKDQKKELALALREQGWTQERIAGVMEVDQRTIGRWLENFRQMPNPDQPSPKSAPPEDKEKAELRRQVEYYEKRDKEQEKQRVAEIDAKVKARVDAMREDYEKRLAAEVRKAGAGQAEIDRLVERRAAEKIAELEKARREADAERVSFEREHEKKLAALKESDERREKTFNERLGRKLKEIDEAAKTGLDLTRLKDELEGLRIESGRLKRKIDDERESLNVRAKMKKILSAVVPVITLSAVVSETVAGSPGYCGLTVEDMEAYVSEIDSVIVYSQAAKNAFRGFVEEIRRGGGLRVVQND
jgi:ParB-like chromosome segregation protein Spo0J